MGSVVDFTGDAIVNAANEGCLGGGGVDGAVTSRGGRALQSARQALPVVAGRSTRCKTGSAVATASGGLACKKKVIHAVGPNYSQGCNFSDMGQVKSFDSLLSSAYGSSVRVALTLSHDLGLCTTTTSLKLPSRWAGRTKGKSVLCGSVTKGRAAERK